MKRFYTKPYNWIENKYYGWLVNSVDNEKIPPVPRGVWLVILSLAVIRHEFVLQRAQNSEPAAHQGIQQEMFEPTLNREPLHTFIDSTHFAKSQ